MMRLCLSSSLSIPLPLSRSAYGSSSGGKEGAKAKAKKGGNEVQRLAPEGDVCLGEEELLHQVRKEGWRGEEG
jgi:hypothetical protein